MFYFAEDFGRTSPSVEDDRNEGVKYLNLPELGQFVAGANTRALATFSAKSISGYYINFTLGFQMVNDAMLNVSIASNRSSSVHEKVYTCCYRLI